MLHSSAVLEQEEEGEGRGGGVGGVGGTSLLSLILGMPVCEIEKLL